MGSGSVNWITSDDEMKMVEVISLTVLVVVSWLVFGSSIAFYSSAASHDPSTDLPAVRFSHALYCFSSFALAFFIPLLRRASWDERAKYRYYTKYGGPSPSRFPFPQPQEGNPPDLHLHLLTSLHIQVYILLCITGKRSHAHSIPRFVPQVKRLAKMQMPNFPPYLTSAPLTLHTSAPQASTAPLRTRARSIPNTLSTPSN
ncbi:hypothetical protein CC80DRAFT_199876 [Byssothecium circinans]|uniref:Uncharacterized protein n=1 Tax=Byssothecium circinans TaxID=147558 RepID=A0A6A5UG66_9PLEO|nr:hypothetical protein CC80DRAFT_199876 [Byssothecium circinans]